MRKERLPLYVCPRPCVCLSLRAPPGHLGPAALFDGRPDMPIMYFTAVPVQPSWELTSFGGVLRHSGRVFDAGLYAIAQRGGSFVTLAQLACNDATEKWALAGVALILQGEE